MTPRTRCRNRRALALAMMLPWLLPLAAMCAPKHADALVLRPLITTTVVWTGEPSCITIWLPAGGDEATPINACSNEQMWTQSYLAPAVGEWIGAQPLMSGADTVSCAVTSTNGRSFTDYGPQEDPAHTVSCLVRWAG